MNEKQISDLLLQKNFSKAIEALVSTGSTDEDVKKFANVAGQVLAASSADSDKIASSLNTTQLDLLMKYTYKCLETGQNSSALFKWHKSISDIGGSGCIIRAIVKEYKEK